jgi:hypothetical protein
MTAHPFEIKPSASSQTPDELMITWGNTPSLSVATIYLPAVAANDIITLADRMYVKHRLSAIDAHTAQCPAGDVTFVPIPQGQGRYAGLLSVDLVPTVRQGDIYTVAVRQLTLMSATIEPSPPPPQIARKTRAAGKTRAAETVAQPKTFSWRQVLGAFQYTLTVTPAQELLYPQERLLAWLKWRIGVTPTSNRWLPVLQRYLVLTEGLVLSLGGDPKAIPPSQVGNVPGKRPVPPSPPPAVEEFEYTGKVIAIHYDRFGDFCGFVILTEAGHEHRFRGHEHAIEELVHQAWVERTVVSVLVHKHDPEWPATLILRQYH